MHHRLPTLIAALTLVLLTTACGSSDDAGSAEDADRSGALASVSADGSVGEQLQVAYEGKVTAEEAETAVLEEGDGNAVEANSTILMHLYIGNGTSGEQSINTYEDGQPVSVRMSEDQLFKPVLDAVVGQKSGSRVAVAASVEEVWGPQGQPQLQLKAGDTAVFVADIVSVEPVQVLDAPQGEELEPPKDAPKVLEEDGEVTGIDWSDASTKAPKELEVITLVEGDGPEVGAQEMVTFDYFGAVWGEKKPFDESFSREPTAFAVGVNQLIPAWDQTIPGLTRGSRVMIIAPPKTAYGDQDQPDIPGGSTLVFVVDVLGVDA
ncbi:MAG: FKBP-type peptidyl-prolyl cis-trans isomerase [Actinomycetes bacterium]